MKKWALVTGMLMAILCTFVPAAMAEDVVTTKAGIQAGVSFRDQPTTSSNVMRLFKTGEVVTVLDWPNPNWYFVQDAQGVKGYVSSSSKYIAITSNAKIIYGVNFRTQPSSTDGSKVIRMLTKGEEVYVTEKVNDSWYKIQDQSGVTGYVSSSSKYLVTDFSVVKPVLPIADRIEAVIAAASAYMGTPYEFGSTRYDTTTFDCSDLVLQAFWDATRTTVPSDSAAQGTYVRSLGPVSTDWTTLKRGDLMFFSSYKGSKASDYAGIDPMTEEITHVGIYLGDGTVLHTYSPESGGVRIDAIAGKQWDNRFLYGGKAFQ